MKENKRYKRLKTAKWISTRKLVSGLLLTVRSAGRYLEIVLWIIIREQIKNLADLTLQFPAVTDFKKAYISPQMILFFVAITE